jgi:pimeloyl-ACP methyl ester carboxylesterase
VRALRRFVRVDGRDVHYLRAGAGPPVVLLHSAMSSAHGQLPLLERLAGDHTVFAFDHPGMGDSDPLPGSDVTAADAADALRATFAALRLPSCPVYGSHTGAAVALELGRRHPRAVSAVVLDGPCLFDARERAFYRSEEYLSPFEVKHDGSHLIAAWVKARDHTLWFPWSARRAANRFMTTLAPPAAVHAMFVEMLRAGDGYRAVYRAAFVDGAEAAAALTVPATFMAPVGDPLYVHLDRLPQLREDQRILRVGAAEQLDAAADVLRGYRVRAAGPPDRRGQGPRHYVERGGGQLLVRAAGERRRGRPLLLLHDGRWSSRMFEPLLARLGRARPVYAPDLPDSGASDPLPARRPAVADYADAVDALGLDGCDVYAVGAGAAVALELRRRRKRRILLEAPELHAPAAARRLARDLAPPLEPVWDGAHLNRLWLMLRDEFAFRPWFDHAAPLAVDAPTDWTAVHGRAVDIVRSLATYHRPTVAALEYDWRSAMRPDVVVAELPAAPAARAARILGDLGAA